MAVVGDIGLDLTPEGRAAMERLNELADVTIEVGYQADQEAADDETSLAEVAYWNHYGTLHKDGSVMIPARPFMDTIKKHSDELSEFSQQALSSLETADAVTNAIGSQAKSMIQDLNHLDLICEALDCSPTEILVREPNPEPRVRNRTGFEKPVTGQRKDGE